MSSCATTVVVRERPVEPVYVRPAPPRPDYVWVDGEWARRHGHYEYIHGYWTAPRPGHVWHRGHWENRRGGYIWIGGSW
jgi:hypothetical protein